MRHDKQTDLSERLPSGDPPREVNAFDVDFYSGSRDNLVGSIITATGRPFSYIVTPNVNHLVQLERDEQLRHAYRGASHRPCDSRVLNALLALIQKPVQEVIPGSDLTATLMEVAQRRAWTVSVIGSEVDDIATMRRRYPGVEFLHHNPPMGFIERPDDVRACLDFVAQHPAHLVILSVGCPRQEVLARRILDEERSTGVGLCVGASINFLSGKVKRAPKWMQRLSLEWLHRMCMEPGRLVKRYATDAVLVLPIIFRNLR
ncbi:WecB/TagA/CpsF family glycosyltransferase [Pseudomonas sp. Marseille-QA0892]